MIAQRLPVEQLHDNERGGALQAEVVDGADVRVIERGGGACFPLESEDGVVAPRASAREELEGDVTSWAS